MLVLDGLVGLHRTVQLQLLQHYSSGHRPVEFKPMYNHQLQAPVRCSAAKDDACVDGMVRALGGCHYLITPPRHCKGPRRPELQLQTPPVTEFSQETLMPANSSHHFKRRLRFPSKSFPGGSVVKNLPASAGTQV